MQRGSTRFETNVPTDTIAQRPIVGLSKRIWECELDQELRALTRRRIPSLERRKDSLQDIRAQPDKTFTAKLTWWQLNPWCATRDLPIVGRRNEFGGIAFEVPRMCGVGYMAELDRSPSGWVGRASSGYGWGLALDLKAD